MTPHGLRFRVGVAGLAPRATCCSHADFSNFGSLQASKIVDAFVALKHFLPTK